jgi:hypothetical protein
MLSHETTKQIRELQDKVNEVMASFKCTRDEAWHLLTANGAYKAAEVAKKIKARQDQIAIAEKRAKAAYNATYSSNIQYDEGDIT